MEHINYDGDPQAYEPLIENGYDFSIEDAVRRGWELFKAYPEGFVIYFLLVGLSQALLGWMLGDFFGTLITAVTGYLFGAGFYIVADRIARGVSYEFGNFFEGFQHFRQLAPASLIVLFATAVGLVLLILPGIYLAIGYMFVTPLIVLQRFEFWAAMETSRKVISQRWFSLLWLVMVLILINILGALALGVGLFVTAPLSSVIVYAAYEAILGKSALEGSLEEKIDKIGYEDWREE